MPVEPHIARWWDIANERRARLINKKHLGGGLSDRQELELVLLQGVAELIMNHAAPIDFRPLEALERKVRRIAARMAKASLKYHRKKAKETHGR